MASRAENGGDQQQGGGRKGHIPESVQLQARKAESPVVNELLVSARKGYTAEVMRLLQKQREGGATTAVIADKVKPISFTLYACTA